MAVQAALGSDIALVFDECTPFHADREYTARSTERTHRWLDRCLEWHDGERARRARPSSGSSRAASTRICGASRRGGVRGRRSTASRSAARLGRDKEEMYGVLDMTLPHLPADAPKHLLGIGEPDDLLDGIARGIDVFDCAVPTRLARHGMALAPLPERTFPLQRPPRGLRRRRGAAGRGLPLRRLRAAHPRLPALPRPRARADRRAPADRCTTSPTSSGWSRRPRGDPRPGVRRLPGGGAGRQAAAWEAG